MTNNDHDIVREQLLEEYPDVRQEYERLKPLFETTARRIQASRCAEPRGDATG